MATVHLKSIITDTVITFEDAEPGFKLGASQGANSTRPISEDSGRVWKVAMMTFSAMVNPVNKRQI
jgi:hypothetical protein